MLRFFLRIIAVLLLATAFAAAVIDGARSIAGGSLLVTSFAQAWSHAMPDRFAQFQTAAQARLPHWAWSPLLTGVLALPSFVVLGVVGLIILRLGQPPRRPIGYSSR
jgi:hypothetical protein